MNRRVYSALLGYQKKKRKELELESSTVLGHIAQSIVSKPSVVRVSYKKLKKLKTSRSSFDEINYTSSSTDLMKNAS